MHDLPPGMMTEARAADHAFSNDEQMYRRVPFELWDEDDDDFDLDVVGLPDMSVVRGKYAHPEWARFDRNEYVELGVLSFRVGEIPTPFLHVGVFEMQFRPEHVPLKKNYPHSEVRAYSNGEHVDGKQYLVDPEMHLRWREKLFRSLKEVLKPREEIEFRVDSPPINQ